MKPSFALTLSFEGIDLLHRAPDGWRAVGSVGFDTPDLSAALEALRQKALLLSPEGLTSKLVLPEDQIKYLSVPLKGTDRQNLQQLAEHVIEGATPYALADLAIDWRQKGDSLQVAAVARETLAEAEAFAHEHQFNPVSFVANPEVDFSGEPFFGGTHAATELFGGPVSPDEHAIQVVGAAEFPDPELPEAPMEPLPEPEEIRAPQLDLITLPEEPAPVEVAPEPEVPEEVTEASEAQTHPLIEEIAAPALDTLEAQESYDDAASRAESDLAPSRPLSAEELELIEAAEKRGNVETSKDEASPPAPAQTAETSEPLADTAVPEAPVSAPSVPAPPPAAADPATPAPMVFSTVRAKRNESAAGGAPKLEGASRETPPEVARKLSVTPDTTPPSAAKASPPVEAPDTQVARAKDTAEAAMLGMADSLKPTEDAPASSFFKRRQRAPQQSAPAPGPAAPIAALAASTEAEEPRIDRPLSPAEIAARNAERAPKRQAKKAEQQRMTVFGARAPEGEAAVIGGKPRFLGLILTAMLLAFLVAVAAWASFSETGFAGLFASEPDSALSELLPDEGAPVEDSPPAASEELAAAPLPDLPPVEGSFVGAARSDDDGTELSSIDPELAFEPESPLADPQTDSDLVEELVGDDPQTQILELPSLSTEERYATSGVWQDAPDQPETPSSAALDDFYVASIDPNVSVFDAVALPSAALATSDQPPVQRSSPAAAGTRFDIDPRGLVTATPEGALTPDGILVYAGAPPARPPRFPERAQAEPEGLNDAEKDRLSKIRPKARPGDLIEKSERSQLGGRTLTELATLRPRSRPEQGTSRLALLNGSNGPLVDLNGESAVDDEAIDDAVAEAVLKPRARPSNFGAIVDRASDAPDEVQIAAASRSQPQIPSSASVARQATIKNQLNLRQINLIGVYGQANDRRALVRLSNGRYKKVKVGDKIDGGKIKAIGETELSYVKSGRTVTLKMPRG